MGSVENGTFLTWEDVWVMAYGGKGGLCRPILQGLTGYAQPGEILAIMGPSGCGKSTLLDTLVGRQDSNARRTGDILINGRKQLALVFGTSVYVAQDDVLMTTQTVKEAVYYSAQLQLPDSMPASEKERAETTIREKGLQDAINTRIGGGGKKGLSGWQKRRVSICIEILTQRRLLFLDEPTSGLDSAASYHVMSRIIDLAQQNKRTVIASIHQPSSEAFELFHNLYLLSSGRTIYFGPASAANEFYAVNGFPCPSLGNPSDHFLRTINKDFDQDIEHGPSAKSISPIEVIEILENSYKSSHICHQVADRVAEISEMGGGALEKGSQASFINQSLILTRRSFVNMYRDVGYYWLRLGMDILICLCGGAIFYIIGYIYESIQVFHRERLNGHYGVVTYVIGNTLSSMPFLFLISVIPGAIAYYSIGLRKGFDHFVYFAMVSFGCTMLVESLMMILASIVPNFLMGRITDAGIQGIMILNSGFARLPNDLRKPVWRYPMYYISFHKYAVQGFCKNEYSGLKFSHSAAGGPRIIDDEDVLRTKWQVELGYNKWVNLAISFGMKIIYRLLFLVIMKTIKKVNPMLKALFSVAPKQATQVSERPSTPIQPLFLSRVVFFLSFLLDILYVVILENFGLCLKRN